MEIVDILQPPLFEPSGRTEERDKAYQEGSWVGVFNLWVFRTIPEPAIIYQVRGKTARWEPNKFDVSVGGHYAAGEKLLDGLREAEEELGKKYTEKEIKMLGRRLNISFDTKGVERHNVVDIAMVEDNSELNTFVLQEEELEGIAVVPLVELRNIFEKAGYFFEVTINRPDGTTYLRKISVQDFPTNWDMYHYRVATLLQRYCQGEENIEY